MKKKQTTKPGSAPTPERPGEPLHSQPGADLFVPAMQQGDNAQLMAQAIHTNERIRSDVLGSYTGTPEDGDQPVQDADDL